MGPLSPCDSGGGGGSGKGPRSNIKYIFWVTLIFFKTGVKKPRPQTPKGLNPIPGASSMYARRGEINLPPPVFS